MISCPDKTVKGFFRFLKLLYPLSMRLNALLPPQKRNNASIIYFTLSVVTVLDYFVNNEDSWAYENNDALLFRSKDGTGIIPQFGIEEKIDADALFKQVLAVTGMVPDTKARRFLRGRGFWRLPERRRAPALTVSAAASSLPPLCRKTLLFS
jgi:hypothetical protein